MNPSMPMGGMPPPYAMGGGAHNPMDMIRQNLMTIFMMKTAGGAASGNGGSNGNNDIYGMAYSMAVLFVVERIMAAVPMVTEKVKNYIESYYAQKMTEVANGIAATASSVAGTASPATNNKPKKKESSITVEVQLSNSENIIGHALLDYVTNLPNTVSIIYRAKTYSLNHSSPILVDSANEVYIVLKNSLSGGGSGGADVPSTVSSRAIGGGGSGSGGGGGGGDDSVQVIELYSYELKIDDLRDFLDRIVYEYKLKLQNKLGDKCYYFSMKPMPIPRNPADNKLPDYSMAPPHFLFTMKPFVTNRRFKNVIGTQSKRIQQRVEFFRDNKKWYDDKGVPYTLGFLLSGPPGGGKTSTIKCVANEMKRHIINVVLSGDVTKTQMENLFFSESIHVQTGGKIESYQIPISKRLYVFEDIDCQGGCDVIFEREKAAEVTTTEPEKEDEPTHAAVLVSPVDFAPMSNMPMGYASAQSLYSMSHPGGSTIAKRSSSGDSTSAAANAAPHAEKLTLSHLLNLLDGILETPGRIIIMTSNFPKKIDRAMIRPGRIDLICEFKRCDHEMIIEFFTNYYNTPLSEEQKRRIRALPSEKYTPAEFSKILFENIHSIEDALAFLENA